MDLCQDDKLRNQQQFDCYMKKVLRNYARDLNEKKKRQSAMETHFSDMPAEVFERIAVQDYHPSDFHSFCVFNYRINIKSDDLSDALRELNDKKRSILLLYYGAELTDVEIGNYLRLAPYNIKMTRLRALEELKKYIGDKGYADK